MQKVVVLGSLNKDLVSFVKKHPMVGETISCDKFEKFNGGKGANQAVAIARLGVKTTMLGAIGNDAIGQEMLDALREDNINTHNIKIKDTNSGIAIITVDQNSLNSIIVHGGANEELSINDVESYRNVINANQIFVTQLENKTQTILKALKIAKANKLTTILTPAPASKYDESLLEYSDILTPNEYEFKSIFGIECSKENYLSICSKYPDKTIIVTLGENGVMFKENSKVIQLPIHKVEAKDTTAAGDAFVGGLIYGLANNKQLKEAIEFGMKVAAISVTREGAQSSLPTLKEVKEF